MGAISRDNWTTGATQGRTNEIMRDVCASLYDMCVNNCDDMTWLSRHEIM